MPENGTATPAPLELFERWTHLLGKSQQLMLEFMTRDGDGAASPGLDPLAMMATWAEVTAGLGRDPARLVELQQRYWGDVARLWQAFASGKPDDSPVAAIKDKRFADKSWSELPVFDFLRQSYLLASQYMLETISTGAETLSERERAKAMFHARQFVDALSPTNYALTNPQVLQATVESGGENLLRGLEHMFEDIRSGRMKMTDEAAFEVGRNVAATPGKVVFENRLFQLIQYSPMTSEVYEIPLLIFPPWINKFYILDLTAEKSFIRWCVEQGLTVFIVSWRNADSSLADATLDNYIGEGQLTAIAKVLEAPGAPATSLF